MSTPLGLQQPTLDVVAAAYAAVVLERQIDFEGTITGPVELDLTRGEVISVEQAYAVTLLGYLVDDGRSWAWGWEHPAARPDHPATTDLAVIRDIGERFDIPELITPVVPLSRLSDGGLGPEHTLAVVGCGLIGGRAYHVVEYDGDTVFLVITDDEVEPHRIPAEHTATLLGAALEAFPFDHRLTVETYLGVHGLPASADGRRTTADLGDGHHLMVEYDALDRVIALDVR